MSHTSSSFPLPSTFSGNPTRALHPRQLVLYDDETGEWKTSTDELVVSQVPYLAVSYHQTDFPDKEELERNVRGVCESQGLDAYWLDFACTGRSQEEKNVDLYRIADVFRGAAATVIMIRGQNNKPKSEGWLSWGRRLWTVPEALLSQKLVVKIGTRKIENVDLKKLATHAYEEASKEAILIDLYATAGKDFARFAERFEALCLALWSRLSGPDKASMPKSSEFTAYPGERVYALMGFLGRRITPDRNESEEDAFKRLLDLNGLECDHYPWDVHGESGHVDSLGMRDKMDPSYSAFQPRRRATLSIREKDASNLLPHVSEASFGYSNSGRVACQEGTRVSVLSEIYSWLGIENAREETDTKPIFWLHGLLGSGKSTIAQTIAKRCLDMKILGASFFCSDHLAKCNDVKNIFPTISHQLCRFSPAFNEKVVRLLDEDHEIPRSGVQNQLRKLIIEPLQAVSIFPKCLVIIDSLDMCNDSSSTSVILQALDEYITKLCPLKILITSRPELNITGAFRTLRIGQNSVSLDLNKVDAHQSDKDVEVFFRTRLTKLAKSRGIGKPWPSEQELNALVNQSGGLFMFASTTVKFLEDKRINDIEGQLQKLLHTSSPTSEISPYAQLDSLYLQVFQSGMPDMEDELKERLRKILGMLILCNGSLSVGALASLVALHPSKIRATLCNLHSLIDIPGRNENTIRLIHPSIRDFLTDRNRCTDRRFFINRNEQQNVITRDLLNNLVRYVSVNCIAQKYVKEPTLYGHSNWWDHFDHNADLALTYAFANWAYHLNQSILEMQTFAPLREFASKPHQLDLMISNIDEAIVTFLNKSEGLSKRNPPPPLLPIVLFKKVIYLIGKHWPHSFIRYRDMYRERILSVRNILVQKVAYSDGLYGLDVGFLRLRVALSHMAFFVPYEMTRDIKDEIYVLRMNAKELDEAVAGCSIPKDEKLSAELKESLSRLYLELAKEAEYLYGIRVDNNLSEDSNLFLRSINAWNSLIKDFRGKYSYLL